MTFPNDPKRLPVLRENGPTTPPATTPAIVRAKVGTQMGDLPKPELDALAEEFGLDPARYPTRQHLVTAIHDRRQLIASLDREAMLDVLRWAGVGPAPSGSKEQFAVQIVRVRSMRFSGLSNRGLHVLARLRGCEVEADATENKLVRELNRQEGFFARLSRRRRAWIGSVVGKMIGEEDTGVSDAPPTHHVQPVDSAPGHATAPPRPVAPAANRPTRIKDEIESSGLFGGLANRVKKTADSYLNQKLDEIEARIDRKLDEIDRRLGEWRDKEIANRIRILKITLWASVIVAVISLLYSYVRVEFAGFFR